MDDEWWRHALHASGDVTFIKPCNCTKAADSNGNVHCCCGVMVTENRPKGWTKPRLDQALANQTHALLPHTADTPTDKSLNNARVDATDIFLEPLGHNNPVLWRWMAGWMDVLRPRQQQDNPPPVIPQPRSRLDFIMRCNGNHQRQSERIYKTMMQPESCLSNTKTSQGWSDSVWKKYRQHAGYPTI